MKETKELDLISMCDITDNSARLDRIERLMIKRGLMKKTDLVTTTEQKKEN